jgi:hypothetical protein
MYRSFLQAMRSYAALVNGEEPIELHCAEMMCAWQEIRLLCSLQLA